jgi:hypothetical protein
MAVNGYLPMAAKFFRVFRVFRGCLLIQEENPKDC